MNSGASIRPAGGGLIVLVCFLIAALEGYDIQAFGVAAPRFAAQFGLSAGQIGWAASAAMFGLVAGAFGGGWLADRAGRRPVLLAAVLMFGLFSVATGLSGDYSTLLLARLATGIGFGGAMPNLIAIATEISTARRRAATVTMMFCGLPAGGAAVALLARAGGQGLDWRTIFFLGGGAPLLLAPLVLLFIPETRPAVELGADRRMAQALFGAGRAPQTFLLWLAFGLTLVVLYLMLNWLPTLMVAKGLTAGDGATASLVFNLASIAGALLVGLAIDRRGFRWPLAVTYLALSATMIAMATASGLKPLLFLAGAAGFLVLGAQYALYALAPALYPPHVRASGAGAAVAVGRFGSILGPLVAGQLREAGYSAGAVFAAVTPVVLVAGLAAFALSFRLSTHED